MGCIFCDIIAGIKPAKVVYEDEYVLAFNDINSQAPVHILIIPKKHIATNLELKADENMLIGHLFQTANRIASEKGIAESGFRLVMNCNRNAGQTVFHMHLHVLGGRVMRWPPG
jgi:histidine triad (HIT) family protein